MKWLFLVVLLVSGCSDSIFSPGPTLKQIGLSKPPEALYLTWTQPISALKNKRRTITTVNAFEANELRIN